MSSIFSSFLREPPPYFTTSCTAYYKEIKCRLNNFKNESLLVQTGINAYWSNARSSWGNIAVLDGKNVKDARDESNYLWAPIFDKHNKATLFPKKDYTIYSKG